MVQFPIDCDTPRKKHQFCVRFQEILRLVHNAFGRWYRVGLTQIQYDKLVYGLAHFLQKTEYPLATITQLQNQIMTKYPYVAQLSEADWTKFLVEDFEERSGMISGLVANNRDEMKSLLEWSEELDL
ncbi:MAG: hypothetical protein ACFFCW_00245 [Candidatus Hodarchaeota archaeon]